MLLEEIFKTNPELLENKEVKELIKYVEEMHDRTYSIAKKDRKFYDNVLELMMYSNLTLINGRSEKETIELIMNLLNK